MGRNFVIWCLRVGVCVCEAVNCTGSGRLAVYCEHICKTHLMMNTMKTTTTSIFSCKIQTCVLFLFVGTAMRMCEICFHWQQSFVTTYAQPWACSYHPHNICDLINLLFLTPLSLSLVISFPLSLRHCVALNTTLSWGMKWGMWVIRWTTSTNCGQLHAVKSECYWILKPYFWDQLQLIFDKISKKSDTEIFYLFIYL